ncbi:MAG TPA: nucleoside-diphosphate sugar epimerase [Pricia sp.]|uniref:Nucleoside-diphosphate sugar epimerase n=2 Tax=root TaxID=1 RepID=A0A831QR70_9FLAO|nr:nucleoside-diphosphate sugar epimerase [Pricia sp.]HEA23409.1 nucleoside-diphosphate sugar epimerase [Pricia antarctica]
MKKTAIILGATGLTGSLLLETLCHDDRYDTIKLFSRTKMDGLPSKVKQWIGDLLELENFKEDFTADEVYCCIGTTTKKTPDKTRYRKIDFGIPVTAAKLTKANGIPTYLVVSALGADANSSIFYNKTKGEMEEAVLSEKIEKTHILQPSIIGGHREEKRIGEKMALAAFRFLQPLFIGKLKKYRITDAKDIAQAMVNLANSNATDIRITSASIKQYANL